jgi:hypothetical protein
MGTVLTEDTTWRHIDNLLKAFDELKEEYGDLIRVANPLYALK